MYINERVRVWLGYLIRQRPVVGYCKYGNEPLGYIIGSALDQQRYCQLLKKNYAPCNQSNIRKYMFWCHEYY